MKLRIGPVSTVQLTCSRFLTCFKGGPILSLTRLLLIISTAWLTVDPNPQLLHKSTKSQIPESSETQCLKLEEAEEKKKEFKRRKRKEEVDQREFQKSDF